MKYHFIGVCGVAMAQIAAWMKDQGATVTGSDEGVYPPMSDFLAAQGIEVKSPYQPVNIGDIDIAIIGNSTSRGNPEVEAVLEKRLPYLSLPELIHSQVLHRKLPIVISGTHGKTTTTAALAQILKSAHCDPGFMIGGLPVGWEAGFAGGKGRWFVIEGDEYDSAFFDKRPKFLHYAPQIAVINNIEFDHADIYSSVEEIFLQFRRLIQLIPRNGGLILNADALNLQPLADRALCPVITFSLRQNAAVRCENIMGTPAGMEFRLKLASGLSLNCHTSLWGDHQLSNLVAAAAAAEFAGVLPAQIAAGIETFRGVRRRMELKYSDGRLWFYEDFAHHPTAVRAALASLKERHPDLPLIAAFEPRSNTMVRNYLQDEMTESLAVADKIFLGRLHRQEKIPEGQRLDAAAIVASLSRQGKEAHHYEVVDEILEGVLKDIPPEAVIVAMSNGAFSGFSGKLVEALKRREF